MRKIWIIAVAAVAVALAGCNREIAAPVAGDGLLRAAIETPTRVSFTDEGVFSWQAGDAIAVSTNAGFKTFTLASGAGAGSAAFEGDLSGVTSATVAVYPASIAKDDATVTLPAEYAWAEGQSNAAMFCSQVSLTAVNSFKHLGGILKITYAEIPADADALVLTAEAKITGDFAIADGKIAAGAGTDQVKVTFTAGSNPAAFYIPVPTGEYKFAVELQKAGAAIEGTSIATTNPVKVERKSLILMDPIQGAQPGLKMEIATAEDFLAFVEHANEYAATDEVKLTADITLPETFAPDTLWCNFDGQGHTVTYNFSSDVALADVPAAANLGLFRVAKGSVKNLKAAGSLTSNAPSGTYHIGGIAGMSGENTVFENCESAVHILGTTKLTHHMGGIVGFSSTGTSFKDCRNTGTVETILEGAANASQIGGIVGHLDHSATFENCVNDGELKYVGNGTARIAGMAGYLYGPQTISFKDCVNNGDVTSVGFKANQYTYAAGISAYFQENAADPTTVEYIRCTNNGKITCNIGTGGDTAQNRAAGIAGHAGKSADITFQDCVNNGEITTDGTGGKNVIGGIIGFGESSGNVTCDGCVNAAAVRAASAAGGIVGGLVGQTQSASSTFTNFSISYGSDVEIKSGTVGAAIGKAAALTTAMTGKVTAVTVTKGETATVLTADNYQDYVLGDPTLGEGGSKEGVLFDGTPMMFSGGKGTAAQPYKINTAADLVALAEKVNNEATYADFADKYYVQVSDIEMRDVATSPIGKTTALAFKGQYDGRGKGIANLSVDGDSEENPASGLFGYADGATFKDIVLRNRTNAGTFGYVAGLVGRADNCTITGCSVREGVLKAGNSYAGGITAYLGGGSVTSCTVFALKIESAYNHVGGFVGEFFDGSMTACTLDGAAIITGKQNIGGLAGWFDKGTMKDCRVAGSSRITASGDGVGGLVGRGIAKKGGTCLIDGCLVESSFVEGAFSVGGLMGYAYPDANGPMLFYNSGMIGTDLVATSCDTGGDPAKGDSMIAGICGWMRASDNASSAKIINCFAHFRPGGFVLRLAMVNASAGGVFGYTSLSNAGTIEIANFVTNLGENHLYVGGSAVTSSVKRYGAFYGMLPNKAITIRKSFCVTGLPMYGETGASVVQEDNVALEPGALGTCVDKLSAFAASYTDYPLKGWELSSGGLPVVK